MILAIDVGNTNAVFGLFSGKKLLKEWRCPTRKLKFPIIKIKISAVIIASVVPSLNKKLREGIRKRYKVIPFFVNAQNIPGLKVRLKNKREIGADRVVDALAAYSLYKGPLIVVDFGTATTFDAISARGEYMGGAIAPGIAMARDALYEQTAKLPKIKISAPKRIIGNDTISAMQSGLIYGYVAMVEGMVKRMSSELQTSNFKLQNKSQPKRSKSKIKVIATGGLAPLICKYTKVVDRIDANLTLKGLRMIGDLSAGRQGN